MAYTFLDYARDIGFDKPLPEDAPKENVVLRNYAIHDLWCIWQTHRYLLFQPMHQEQRTFLYAPQPIIAYLAPNRQGKTYCGAYKAAIYTTCDYPPEWPDNKRFRGPVKGLIFVSSIDKQFKEAVLPKLREWLPHPEDDFNNEYWDIHWERKLPVWFKHKPTGSEFSVVSHEVKRKTLEGGDYHWVWCDEPPPYKKYVSLLRGVLQDRPLLNGEKGFGEIFITATPIFEEYFDREIIQKSNYGHDLRKRDPNIFVVCVKGNRNKYVSRKAWDIFKKSLDSPLISKGERIARTVGDLFTISGLVYPQFRELPERYFIKPFAIPYNWTRYMMWDPHDSVESFDWILWVAVAPNGQQFLYDEVKTQLPTPPLIEEILRREESTFHNGVSPFLRIVDEWAFNKGRTGWKDGGQRSLVQEIQSHHPDMFFIKAYVKPGCIETGRNLIEAKLVPRMIPAVNYETGQVTKDQVREPLIRVFSTCTNFRDASYSHSEKDGKEVRGPSKCCFDCLRWLQLQNPVCAEISEEPYTEAVPGNDERKW